MNTGVALASAGISVGFASWGLARLTDTLTSNIKKEVGPVEALAADNVALTPTKAENEAVSQTAGPSKCWALRV